MDRMMDVVGSTIEFIDLPTTYLWYYLCGGAILFFIFFRFVDIISHIVNHTYIYNICWEDPAVDLQILNIKPHDVIFRICSAGDVVLDYSIEGPQKIVVCDLNQHQLYLFELKVQMLKDPLLTYKEWWDIWANSDVKTVMKVWKRMRHTMSADARKWWDPRIECTFRSNFAFSGSSGIAARFMVKGLSYLIGLDLEAWGEKGFSYEYIVDKDHMIRRLAWWMLLIFPTFLAPLIGVPPNQIGSEYYTQHFYENILREILCDPDFGNHNYFYRYYIEGGYKDESCAPRTLQSKYFDLLRRNSSCFEWHHATVQETMERIKPHSLTKVVLLDHMDWMPNKIVHDEWIALQRATVPGSQILWRSGFTNMDDKPLFNNLDVLDLSAKWYPEDRVKTYRGTFLTSMPQDHLPYVETDLSECQKAGFIRKLQTSTKMILHPLLAGKSNDHGSNMSSFYAAQAKGYDALREDMLVARPDMMSSFGLVKEGHTWLDVGGGTGRNIHYLRAQLDKFERIVVLDICPELLEMGKINAKLSFTEEQCAKISWVNMDINTPSTPSKLAAYLNNSMSRGFDTVTFSYSLSMIPDWQGALHSAKTLLSFTGRIVISDFDTYTEKGNTMSDKLINLWYKQDGVRIEAKSRDFLTDSSFTSNEYTVKIARFQKRLLGVSIPHYVGCVSQKTFTCSKGYRESLSGKYLNLKERVGNYDYGEEKKEA